MQVFARLWGEIGPAGRDAPIVKRRSKEPGIISMVRRVPEILGYGRRQLFVAIQRYTETLPCGIVSV